VSGVLWPHRPLFRRIYLHGLLLLALVAVAIAAAVAVMGRQPMALSHLRIGGYAAWRVAHSRPHPELLAQELRQAREDFGAEITIWALDGSRLATNVEPPLPPLGPADLARLHGGPFPVGGRHRTVAAEVPGEPSAYLLLSGPLHVFSWVRFAVLVAVVLLALAVGSIPLARGIAAPLERLTAAARALGSGNLSSRAGLARRDDEVGVLAVAFDEMADRLERLVRSERELLANLSHELRTPLARMRVALDLAAEGDLARAQRFLAEIGTDLAELERLVGDVLTASRLDLGADRIGELPLRREPVDACGLLREVAARFGTASPGRALELELAEPLPEIEADPALLRRALENLLDNARKYSDPGEPVVLSARSREGALVIEVRDRGIGIDPGDLPRLFTPFFRTDRSRARGTGGIGLGLALARRIVEAHGGTISVQSAPGEGTVLRLSLPGPVASLH
jgi:two-component system, OmpR family, sensor kinase